MKDNFLWLQQWFQDHYNGNWEHNGRIHLETIDNPGWILKIDLNDTDVVSKNFRKINDIHRSEQDWMVCKVENAKFETYGGIENLPDILKAFRYWIGEKFFDFTLRSIKITENSMEEDDFLWLQQWYQDNCDGDWEHTYGICIKNLDNPGWSLTIDLNDTDLEYANLQDIKIKRSEQDWIFCEVKDTQFEARCGVRNLPEVLKIFRHWAIENEPSENHEYTWDDYVIVKEDAPKISYPGKTGTVCYMWEIKREETAKKYHTELGDWLYLIRRKYGTTIRVAGRFLEKYEEE